MKDPSGRHRLIDPGNDTHVARRSLYEPLRASYRRSGVLGVEQEDVSVLFLALGLLLIGLMGNILVFEYLLGGGL